MVYSDYIYIQSDEFFLLPELQAANLHRAFLFNARFNYSAAPRALKLYLTVYSLKKQRRSFHTVALPFFFERRYRLDGVYFQRYGKFFLTHTVSPMNLHACIAN